MTERGRRGETAVTREGGAGKLIDVSGWKTRRKEQKRDRHPKCVSGGNFTVKIPYEV